MVGEELAVPISTTCYPAWPCTQPGETRKRTSTGAPPSSPVFPVEDKHPWVRLLWDPTSCPSPDGPRQSLEPKS
jgi:hypothetical protein